MSFVLDEDSRRDCLGREDGRVLDSASLDLSRSILAISVAAVRTPSGFESSKPMQEKTGPNASGFRRPP